jgi:hypothetical protein
MADKQVDIVSTEDSVAIGDTLGNKVTVTGNKLDVNASLASGGVVEAAEGPNNPNLTFLFTYVQAGDIGVDYVAGSQGMAKTMKVYPTGAAGGSPAKLSTYKYQDPTQPNGVTEAVETTSTV